MSSAAKASARTVVFGAVTIGLGIAYLVAALAFAGSGQTLDFGWPGRSDFGMSLLLAVLALYSVAGLLGKWNSKQGRPGAGWRGAVYGVLALLAAIVVAGGWNAAADLIDNAHFRYSSVADFWQQLGYACYDYIVKPLVWIMPLGSIVAGLLGWWAGRRTAEMPS